MEDKQTLIQDIRLAADQLEQGTLTPEDTLERLKAIIEDYGEE